MDYLYVFLLGCVFSFLGSIPPGTLNLSVLQLGLEGKSRTALKFAFAVSIVEYPYAWIAVEFDSLISKAPLIIGNFQLISSVVMITLGIFNVWSSNKPATFAEKFNQSGFRRGLVLSLLNPMAIPFWMAFIAYMTANGWMELSSPALIHSFVAGTSAGALILLTIFSFLASRLAKSVRQSRWIKLFPGIILLLLGSYALFRYFFLFT